MASPIPDAGPLRAPQGVHLLLAVGMPTLFVTLGEWLVTGQTPAWPRAPLGLAYAVLMAFWSSWRLRTHQGTALRLWLWLVFTLTLWALMSVLEGLPWPRTFDAQGLHPLWFAVAFVQGHLAVLWAGQLASRGRLFQLIEGLPEGPVLEERVRDFQLDADYSQANHATLSASLVVLGVTALVLGVVASPQSSGLSSSVVAAFLVLCLLVGVLLRTYRREMQALMYGHRFSLADKWGPLAGSALLAVLAGLGAWALLGLGGPWFDLSRFLPGAPSVPTVDGLLKVPVPAELSSPQGDYRLAVLVTLLALILQTHRLGLVVAFVLTVLLWAAPWAAVAFLVWPLVRWLLSGGSQTRGLLGTWVRLLRAQIQAFLQALRRWWGGPPEREGTLSPSQTGARDWLLSLLGRPVPGRRAPYPEVVEAFLSLARWAEPVTVYRQGETTREFLDRLATVLPEHQADLVLARDLLDRELFGPQGLGDQERKAFLLLVAGLTATSASHGPDPGVS